ncbi:hypothetical protein TSUD_278280 [Trifolium subterraneum]|uniref:Uncharacterized protein n=1 Tax=Trifolium subterraneum TaxID=3900 RepID=A0A2Z6MW18_TRISU|nr:hypothetical protein TSUD_278280 [Trifolium subterraneum]
MASYGEELLCTVLGLILILLVVGNLEFERIKGATKICCGIVGLRLAQVALELFPCDWRGCMNRDSVDSL